MNSALGWAKLARSQEHGVYIYADPRPVSRRRKEADSLKRNQSNGIELKVVPTPHCDRVQSGATVVEYQALVICIWSCDVGRNFWLRTWKVLAVVTDSDLPWLPSLSPCFPLGSFPPEFL
jgi:hypothetical protein